MKSNKTLFLLLNYFLMVTISTLNCQIKEDFQNFEFSKAGYFELNNSGRNVYDFNSGWRFFKGSIVNGESVKLDDSNWEIVNCPNGLELNSDQVSGGANYQGEAWYRKKFILPYNSTKKRTVLHFESVMGKCNVFLNGELITSHFGGYLPFEADLTSKLKNGENIIAVLADNSDDPLFPPGKPQAQMDFSYFGGIYRDIWLVSTNEIYITNPNSVDTIADGGVFIHYENFSKKATDVVVSYNIANSTNKQSIVKVETLIKDSKGIIIAKKINNLSIPKNTKQTNKVTLTVKSPQLWTPDSPNLYSTEIRISKEKQPVDGVRLKIGIRKIEFKGKDGFYLNDEPYKGKLTGVNRHQDYGYVGNALPNNGQLQDALLLKNAGCAIIRAAHYPADPAFMNACDELGLFFIVATPGWQFWNKAPIFEKRVFNDIRNMVRRDRNHASVIWWEPILNETWYPEDFAKRACEIVHEEYPFQGAYTASDNHARGGEHSDISYSHQFEHEYWSKAPEPTPENYKKFAFDYSKDSRTFFVREWGDAVDNWAANNSPSRASRAWGENAMLIQAKHYEQMGMVNTDWETISKMEKQHIGGTMWCGFDHQRGYHTDPFYGGLTDVFRQPKYVYNQFASQKDPAIYGPMIFIAHEMTPFSAPDVTVYTNCEEVRLIRYERDTLHIKISDLKRALPHPSVTFKDAFNFFQVKQIHANREKIPTASFVAEGLIGGKIVARHKIMPAQEVEKISLERLTPTTPFTANGSDFVTIIASVKDKNGYIKRLNNSHIKFEIEGEGEIIDDGKILANPRKIEWGTAPVLVRATNTAGQIKLKASLWDGGIIKALPVELILTTSTSTTPMVFLEKRNYNSTIPLSTEDTSLKSKTELELKVKELEKELNNIKLKEVQTQQTDFVGGKKDKN